MILLFLSVYDAGGLEGGHGADGCRWVFIDLASPAIHRHFWSRRGLNQACESDTTAGVDDVDGMNEMLVATVKLHFLPYFLHVLKMLEVIFVICSLVNWENLLGKPALSVTHGGSTHWPGKLMSFAKAKRENKKIEARQEKRDLEDKYKALEATCHLHTAILHWFQD